MSWVDPNPPSGGGSSGGSAGGSSGGSSSGSSGGSSSGGSSSSGSSSSTSSAPAAPPVDPRIAQLESLFRSAYTSLWGEPPTEAYIKHAAQSGMNVTEFVDRERMKEAFKKTKTYQDEFKALLTGARQAGVF